MAPGCLVDHPRCHLMRLALTGSTIAFRTAPRHFESAIEHQPSYPAACEALPECRARTGDLRGAVAALQEGQLANPDDVRSFRIRWLGTGEEVVGPLRAGELAILAEGLGVIRHFPLR